AADLTERSLPETPLPISGRLLIRSVIGLVAVRPVSRLFGKVRARLTREIRGDVHGIGIAQGIALSHGHVRLDEAGGIAKSGHPGPDVERLRAPERRKQILAIGPVSPLAIGSVTHGTLRRVDRFAALRIRGPGHRNPREPASPDGDASRNVV